MGDNLRSEAQKKADKKYNEKVRYTKNRPLNVTVAVDDYNVIDEFCKNNEISKAQFIIKSCKYIIENNINFKDEK